MPVPPAAGSAARDMERAHGRNANGPPTRTNLRTATGRSIAIATKLGRYASSLEREAKDL